MTQSLLMVNAVGRIFFLLVITTDSSTIGKLSLACVTLELFSAVGTTVDFAL